MIEVDWQRAAAELEWDGSLRNICVLDTTIQDLNKILEILRGLTPAPIYFEGNVVATMPDSIERIFEKRGYDAVGWPRLDFKIGSFVLNWHFLWEPPRDYIEFVLDPREMKSLDDLKELVDFMRRLIMLTKNSVVLTHASSLEHPIIEGVLVSDQISWTTTSWRANTEPEKL